MKAPCLTVTFATFIGVAGASLSLSVTSTSRGSLTPIITAPAAPAAAAATTTVDIETPLIVIESEGVAETPTKLTTSTDWSTVLPTRWYPRRKQAASSAETRQLLFPKMLVALAMIITLLLLL